MIRGPSISEAIALVKRLSGARAEPQNRSIGFAVITCCALIAVMCAYPFRSVAQQLPKYESVVLNCLTKPSFFSLVRENPESLGLVEITSDLESDTIVSRFALALIGENVLEDDTEFDWNQEFVQQKHILKQTIRRGQTEKTKFAVYATAEQPDEAVVFMQSRETTGIRYSSLCLFVSLYEEPLSQPLVEGKLSELQFSVRHPDGFSGGIVYWLPKDENNTTAASVGFFGEELSKALTLESENPQSKGIVTALVTLTRPHPITETYKVTP